jgi:hypothetical protein
MVRISFFLLFFFSLSINAQPGNKIRKADKSKKTLISDSATVKIRQLQDSAKAAIFEKDSIEAAQSFKRNTDYIIDLQKENRAKQKRAAITRIAIGAAFFALLIVGLMRRKKKQG